MKRWSATVPLPEPKEKEKPYLPRLLPAEVVRGVLATVVTWPIPYVLLMVDDDGFFDDVGPRREREMEEVRLWLAGAAEIKASSTVPKIGLVAAGPNGVWFRTRIGEGMAWHPGAPGGGLLALGAAALREGTVPSRAAGDPSAVEWDVRTPAGDRTVAYRLTDARQPGLAIAICTTDPKEIR